MNFKRIKIQNYRAFRDQTSVSLAPLTLVFGENNAGKSSIARILPSLVNSCSGEDRLAFNPVALSDWPTNGRDFIFGQSIGTKIQIGFEYQSRGGDIEVLYEIFNLPEHERSIVSRLTFKKDDKIFADFEWEVESVEKDAELPEIYVTRHTSLDQNDLVKLSFEGILPSSTLDPKINEQAREALSSLRDSLLELTKSAYWLGPLRYTPDRIERRRFKSLRMTPTGREASQILANSHQNKTPVFEMVSSWFESALKHRLTFIEGAFDGDALFGLALSPLGSQGVRVPIADTGTGIAQVLPIILLGALAALGMLGASPILVLENPELHLHDSVHDDLGRFFVQVAKSATHPTLVIETHSENILLAIQIAMAEKTLVPSDVAVNWVRRLSDGSSTVDNAAFDSDGNVSKQWPMEAFSTAPEQAKKLFRLRQKL